MNNRITRLLRSRGVWLVSLIVVAGALFLWWVRSNGGPEALREAYGYWIGVALIPVLSVLAVSPFPSEFVIMGLSAVYGFWLGAAFSWVGLYGAAFVQYFVARRTARDFDFESARARLPQWLQRFPAHHPAFLICARWIPWGPHLVNTAAGVYEVPLKRHAWCAAISCVPYAIVFAAIGASLLTFNRP